MSAEDKSRGVRTSSLLSRSFRNAPDTRSGSQSWAPTWAAPAWATPGPGAPGSTCGVTPARRSSSRVTPCRCPQKWPSRRRCVTKPCGHDHGCWTGAAPPMRPARTCHICTVANRCLGPDGTFHYAKLVVPRLESLTAACLDCEGSLMPGQGPNSAWRYDYVSREIAQALVSLAQGQTYMEASTAVRQSLQRHLEAAGRAAPWNERGMKHGQLRPRGSRPTPRPPSGPRSRHGPRSSPSTARASGGARAAASSRPSRCCARTATT